MPDFDLFVIGGGSGGVACARRAASHGAKVGHRRGQRVGGTCAIRGCVPKKLMHYGAHFAEAFKAAQCYGWDIGAPRLAFERLCEAGTRDQPLDGIYLPMLERAGVQLSRAMRILSAHGRGFVVLAGDESRHGRPGAGGGRRAAEPARAAGDRARPDLRPGPGGRLPPARAAGGDGRRLYRPRAASIFNALGSRPRWSCAATSPARLRARSRQHLAVEIEGHGVPIWNETMVERSSAPRRHPAPHQPRPARGRHRRLRHRPLAGAADPRHRPGGAGRGRRPVRHRRRRRPLPQQPARLFAVGDCTTMPAPRSTAPPST